MTERSGRQGLFERLKKGLEEGIRFARGELNLRTTELPEAAPPLDARAVVGIRERFGMSQAVFARVLNVSAKTVQSWEQGERKPSQAALRLLQILAAEPTTVWQVLGLRPGAGKRAGTRQGARARVG